MEFIVAQGSVRLNFQSQNLNLSPFAFLFLSRNLPIQKKDTHFSAASALPRLLRHVDLGHHSSA